MVIVITKIISQLVYPLNFSLALAVLSGILLWYGRKRVGGVLLAVSLTWLWLWSTPMFANRVNLSLEQVYSPIPVKDMESADAIVVLGGGVGTTFLPRLHPDLEPAADRVWHAARLYNAEKAPVLILSGGAGINPTDDMESESSAMAILLKDFGVPESAILLESESRNTHENAVMTKKILDEKNIKKILLVTSALHMPRAMMIFKANGIEAIPAPTDYEIVNNPATPIILRFLPDARTLERGTRAFKEMLGIAAYGVQKWLSG